MIWIDLDNSPHVPLFTPIIKELSLMGVDVFTSARDFAQTKDLLDVYKINAEVVGRHGGKSKLKKVINLAERSFQLIKATRNKQINLSLNHGSRAHTLASRLKNIQTVVMADYEYTDLTIFNLFADKTLWPVYIPDKVLESVGVNLKRVVRYNGFKEEIYIQNFTPDNKFRDSIGVDDDETLVFIRTPAMVGNYHDSRSEKILLSTIKYLSKFKNVKTIVSCRTELDKQFVRNGIGKKNNMVFLGRPVDGLQMLYAADIAISGGGTMNRESALLGTDTYSIFSGRRPYLDEYLASSGKIKFLVSDSDIAKISLERKKKEFHIHKCDNFLSQDIARIIINMMN